MALSAAIIGVDDGVASLLAWLYVALRVVHSLVQATKNVIMIRFTVFALGSVVLFVLLLRTLLWYSGLSVTG